METENMEGNHLQRLIIQILAFYFHGIRNFLVFGLKLFST